MRRRFAGALKWSLLAACGAGAFYQCLAVAAIVLHKRRERPSIPDWTPSISVLKPLKVQGANFEKGLQSHFEISNPDFELLFGVTDSSDPAAEAIRSLERQNPSVRSRLFISSTDAPNPKVGVLQDLARLAGGNVLVVNDGDIRVAPDYLDHVAAPLLDGEIGLVTCLYRAVSDSMPGRFEALGIATDFAPSALVAQLIGVREFGMGSTLAFRAADLESAGGFQAIGSFIADDYQVGKRISALGKQVLISHVIVETVLEGATWRQVWDHQIRWARTIRLSRGAYFGLPLSNGTFWACIALFLRQPALAAGLVALRLAVALSAAGWLLKDRQSLSLWYLIPARDLFALAVWFAGMSGRRVVWGGRHLSLDREGRIVPN